MNRPWTHSTPSALINMASRALYRLHDRRLRPLGVAFGQIPVLAALSKTDALSQKELAKLARTEQSSMAQLLVRMERDGLIQRTPSSADRRVSMISLTDTGQAKVPQAYSALFETNDRALSGFSEEEVDVLRDLLGRLLDNLEADLEDSDDET